MTREKIDNLLDIAIMLGCESKIHVSKEFVFMDTPPFEKLSYGGFDFIPKDYLQGVMLFGNRLVSNIDYDVDSLLAFGASLFELYNNKLGSLCSQLPDGKNNEYHNMKTHKITPIICL